MPHQLEVDDEYNGHFLAAKTTVILNQWAILHDPRVYPQPENFMPERFLPSGDAVADKAKDPKNIAFG